VTGDRSTQLQEDPLGRLPDAARNHPVLSFLRSGRPESVTLDQRAILGSSPSVDVAVDDLAVSRIHCELEPRDDGLWVRDLGSRNGTYVDGVLVECARLGDGGVLHVGNTDIRVTYSDTPVALDLWPLERFVDMVGRSVAIREVFARMHKVAPTEATVLLGGETGTGKELAARAIHRMSHRHEGPFVVVDCGSIPETLVESELFGHVRGAFTGATAERIGAIEAADGGTVFLALAVPRVAHGAARRRDQAAARRRACRRGDPPRSPQDGERGRVPGGSLLPARGHPAHHPAPPRASRGRSAPRSPLPRGR
jgi:hypothetical protein